MKEFCYATSGSYKLSDFTFVKTKWFTNYNDLLSHIKRQKCQLLSYTELNGKFKATIRYRK